VPNDVPAELAPRRFLASPTAAMTSRAAPFVRRPKLPLVPPPFAGESLSSWVVALADAYGTNWRNCLRMLGLPATRQLRSLSLSPSIEWLRRLGDQTGTDADFIRNRMTLGDLSRGMITLVRAAAPCRACVTDIPPGRSRTVEWLSDLAPWTLYCERPTCMAPADGPGHRRQRSPMRHDLRLFSHRLRVAALDDHARPFPDVPLSAAGCVELVGSINARVKLEVRIERDEGALFVVQFVQATGSPEEDTLPRQMNSRAVSAWYAWHVLTSPREALWRHTRCADAVQTHDLLAALFDPSQQGFSNPAWNFAMSLCAAADPTAARTEAERQQVQIIRDARALSRAGRLYYRLRPDPLEHRWRP
jgi:hypothetical protein